MKFLRSKLRFILIVLIFALMFYRGEVVMMLNPKYSEKSLLGLTLLQVIQQLGPPDLDSGESIYSPTGGTMHQQRAFVYKYANVGRTVYFLDDTVTGAVWDIK